MHSIKQFRITSKHDRGYFTMTLFGHTSEESAIKTFMDVEKCPRSAIIKVEDLSTRPRTFHEVTRLS
jgi:hypothetical protein